MKNKRKNNIPKRIFCLIVFAYIGYILFQQYTYISMISKEEKKYINEINKQKSVAASYEKQKKLYNTDAYVEGIARQKLGMVYPGEKMFVDASK